MQDRAMVRQGIFESSLSREDGIQVGFFYEIDPSEIISSTYPDQLKEVRIAMVSKKAEMGVSLRFPSIYSLRKHFSGDQTDKMNKIPALDEKYTLGSDVAGQLLLRRIEIEEFAMNNKSWSFWVREKSPTVSSSPAPIITGLGTVIAKRGSCWSQLKCGGMISWGARRRVRFLSRHDENNYNLKLLSHSINVGREEELRVSSQNTEEENRGTENSAESNGEQESQKEEEEDDEREGDKGEATSVIARKRAACEITRKSKKRKCKGLKRTGTVEPTRIAKRARRDSKPTKSQVQVQFQRKRKISKGSKERWSSERYKLAEENMLKILKEKGAVSGKPILRPALRSEARKMIGDTGLLDHLLKHMAGKLAPGGEERFRRRHNSDGAMEYWLESANLMDIRREAGVEDPYWTPPPGWRPGDNPSQDPVCAREIKHLKEEIASLKRELEELASKKRGDEAMPGATTPSPAACISRLRLLDHDGSFLPLKEMCIELMKRNAILDDQLRRIYQSLIAIEELQKAEEEEYFKSKGGMAASVSAASGEGMLELAELIDGDESLGATATATATVENKAAKIRRLKSEFRICKPHPASSSLSHSLSRLVGLTPTSVTSSSSSAAATHHHRQRPPASLVNPLVAVDTVPSAPTITIATPQNTDEISKSKVIENADKVMPPHFSVASPAHNLNLNEVPPPAAMSSDTGETEIDLNTLCVSKYTYGQSHSHTPSALNCYKRRQQQHCPITSTVAVAAASRSHVMEADDEERRADESRMMLMDDTDRGHEADFDGMVAFPGSWLSSNRG